MREAERRFDIIRQTIEELRCINEI